jgi:hypothetical protein
MKILFWLSLALILGPGADPVWAHEWFSHQRNPVTGASCCYGGPTGDCQPISDTDWWRDGEDYKVRQGDTVYSIPAKQALPSQDPEGRAAACILYGKLLCFFVPLNG